MTLQSARVAVRKLYVAYFLTQLWVGKKFRTKKAWIAPQEAPCQKFLILFPQGFHPPNPNWWHQPFFTVYIFLNSNYSFIRKRVWSRRHSLVKPIPIETTTSFASAWIQKRIIQIRVLFKQFILKLQEKEFFLKMAHILNIDKLLPLVIITFFTCRILGTQLKCEINTLCMCMCINLTCIFFSNIGYLRLVYGVENECRCSTYISNVNLNNCP